MKIRELLQIEIWSKRTSRKIFVGLGVVVAGYISWVLLDQHWLTSSERNAGRRALTQIDSLQVLSSGSDDKDFDARVRSVQQAVDVAEKAGWTVRDKEISSTLSGYLALISMERDQMKHDKLKERRHIVFTKSDQDFDEKLKSSGIEVKRLLSMSLHSALDQ